jgi:hypothetical protein
MVMILQHRRHAKSHGDDVLGAEEHGASLCAVIKITDPGPPKLSQQLHRCGLPERHLSPNGGPCAKCVAFAAGAGSISSAVASSRGRWRADRGSESRGWPKKAFGRLISGMCPRLRGVTVAL